MNNYFESLQAGDVIVREMAGFGPGKEFRNNGFVKEVTDKLIVCEVWVDLPRTMRFDRHSGISHMGADYGWLIEPEKWNAGDQEEAERIAAFLERFPIVVR